MTSFYGRVIPDHDDFAELGGVTVVLSIEGKDIDRVEVGSDGFFEITWDDPNAVWRLVQGERLLLPPQPLPQSENSGFVTLAVPLARSDVKPQWAIEATEGYIPLEVTKPIAQLLRRGVKEGWFSPSLASRVDILIADTQAYLAAADAAALGLPGAWDRFFSLLKPEAPTLPNVFGPFPEGPLGFGACGISLRSAFASVQAVMANAPEMLGQAITGYVRRAEAVERLAQVAAIDIDSAAESWLRQVIEHAVDLGSATGAGKTLQRLLAREMGERDALREPELRSMLAHVSLKRFGSGVLSGGPKFGPGVPPIGFGRLELCQWQWIECVDALTRPFGDLPVVAPTVDRIEPTAFCGGSAGVVTLWPGAGGFPAQPPSDVRLVVPIPGATVRWSSTRIDIDVPADAPVGCWAVEWELFRGGQGIGEGDPRAACAEFFFDRGQGRPPVLITRQLIGHVLVAGLPFARLSSRGQSGRVQEPGCTLVPVDWVIGSGLENTACRGKISFEARLDTGGGWQPLTLGATTAAAGRDGWHGGSVKVQSATDSTVRLEVTLLIDGQPCKSAQTSLFVQRYQELRLDVPPLVQEGDFQAFVRRSCPAPVGGVAFRIDSDAPNIVPPETGTLPESSTTIQLTMFALRCGSTRLSLSAIDHVGSVRSLVVRGVPRLVNLGPITTWPACSNIRLSLDVHCAGPDPVLEFVGPGGIVRTARLTPSNNRTPTDPWGDASYTTVAESLTEGVWMSRLRRSDGTVSMFGPMITVTAERVRADASILSVTNPAIVTGVSLGAIPLCLGAEVVLEVVALGATEIVVQARESMLVVRRQRNLQCGDWRERFIYTLFRGETFNVTVTGPGGSLSFTRSIQTWRTHPGSVGAVRVSNTSNKKVTVVITLVNPATLQNIPLVLGTVDAGTATVAANGNRIIIPTVKLFDKFIADNRIPDCTPIVVRVILDETYLPIMTNNDGVVRSTAAASATAFRVVSGGATLDMPIDQRQVDNTPT
jgi:hypothetical protein